MDYYDFITPNSKAFYKGKFYKERPDWGSTDNGGQCFFYEEISPYSSSVTVAFGNLLSVEGSMAIRTRTNLEIDGHKISEYKTEQKLYQSAYILTAGGRLYKIERIELDKTSENETHVPFKTIRPSYLLWLVPTQAGEEVWLENG